MLRNYLIISIAKQKKDKKLKFKKLGGEIKHLPNFLYPLKIYFY